MEKSKKFRDMSIYEASDFWDDHDFTEFPDVQETQDLRFSLKKKKLTDRLCGRIKPRASLNEVAESYEEYCLKRGWAIDP